MTKKRYIKTLLLFYLSVIVPCLGWPAIVGVPGDQPTIQAGLLAANEE